MLNINNIILNSTFKINNIKELNGSLKPEYYVFTLCVKKYLFYYKK